MQQTLIHKGIVMNKGYDSRIAYFILIFVAMFILCVFLGFFLFYSNNWLCNLVICGFIAALFIALYFGSKSIVKFEITDEKILIRYYEHFKIKKLEINKSDIKTFHAKYDGWREYYVYITIILKDDSKYEFNPAGTTFLAEYITRNRKEIPEYVPEFSGESKYFKKLHNEM